MPAITLTLALLLCFFAYAEQTTIRPFDHGLSTNARPEVEETDWKFSFIHAREAAKKMIHKMSPVYFPSDLDREISKKITEALDAHRAEMVHFLDNAVFSYRPSNTNEECSEILDPKKTEINLSTQNCKGLSKKRALFELTREVFRKIAETDVELSRWAAHALTVGWNQNEDKLPPFSIAGTYALKHNATGGTIHVKISEGPQGYSIDTGTVFTNHLGGTLKFGSLRRYSSPSYSGPHNTWEANAINPSRFEMTYGHFGTHTAHGKEGLSLVFKGPNGLVLTFSGRPSSWTYETSVQEWTKKPWVRVKNFELSQTWTGAKVSE